MLCDLVWVSPMTGTRRACRDLAPTLASCFRVGLSSLALPRADAPRCRAHQGMTDGTAVAPLKVVALGPRVHLLTINSAVRADVAAGQVHPIRDTTSGRAFVTGLLRLLRRDFSAVRDPPRRASHLAALVPAAAVAPGATTGVRRTKQFMAASAIGGGGTPERRTRMTWTRTSTPCHAVVVSTTGGMMMAALTGGVARAGCRGAAGAHHPDAADGTAQAIAAAMAAGQGTTGVGATAGMTAVTTATALGAATVGAGVAAVSAVDTRSRRAPTGPTTTAGFVAGVAA